MVGQSGCEAGMFCLFLSLWCRSSGVSKLKTWALWCSLHCVCSCRVKWTVSSPAAGTSNKEWSVSQQPKTTRWEERAVQGSRIQGFPFIQVNRVDPAYKENPIVRMTKIFYCKNTCLHLESMLWAFYGKRWDFTSGMVLVISLHA